MNIFGLETFFAIPLEDETFNIACLSTDGTAFVVLSHAVSKEDADAMVERLLRAMKLEQPRFVLSVDFPAGIGAGTVCRRDADVLTVVGYVSDKHPLVEFDPFALGSPVATVINHVKCACRKQIVPYSELIEDVNFHFPHDPTDHGYYECKTRRIDEFGKEVPHS